jgi:hypothetical protein
LTSLPYVEHMGPTRYRVAAAGWVRCDGQSETLEGIPQPSYNGLVAQAQRNQRSILVSFNGYEWRTHNPYIVKVLPGLHPDRRPAFIHFDRFTQEGIVLRVYDGQGSPFSYEELLRMGIMVEVCQYQVISPHEEETQARPAARSEYA